MCFCVARASLSCTESPVSGQYQSFVFLEFVKKLVDVCVKIYAHYGFVFAFNVYVIEIKVNLIKHYCMHSDDQCKLSCVIVTTGKFFVKKFSRSFFCH